MYRIALTLFCLLVLWVGKLFAQPSAQLMVGGYYENSTLMAIGRSNKPLISPSVELGLALDFQHSEAVVFVHASWQRLRADSIKALWESHVKENIRLDNLKIGPGVQFNLWPKRRVQPFLGVLAFIGMPLRLEYELFTTGTLGTVFTTFLPSYRKIKGGAQIAAGWQIFAGVEGKLNEQCNVRLRIGNGRQDQNYDWNKNGRQDGIGRVLRGDYWQYAFEVVLVW